MKFPISVIFTYSSTNQPRAIIDGHVFCKHIDKGVKIYWQCGSYRGCLAKLHTLPDNTITKLYNVHKHTRVPRKRAGTNTK